MGYVVVPHVYDIIADVIVHHATNIAEAIICDVIVHNANSTAEVLFACIP